MTQEHGRVEPISGILDYSKYPLGTMLTLIPYHVSIIPMSLTIVATLLLHHSDPPYFDFDSRVQLQ